MEIISALIVIFVLIMVIKSVREANYRKLKTNVLRELGFRSWESVSYFDDFVTVKSRQALEKYDSIKYFKENRGKLGQAESRLRRKSDIAETLKRFLLNNKYKSDPQYSRIKKNIEKLIENAGAYRVSVNYTSPAGKKTAVKEVSINLYQLSRFKQDPTLLMDKGEYGKYQKEKQKEAVQQKQRKYYEKVNAIIDYASENKGALIIKGSQEQLDGLIGQLFDRTVNSIKKIKTIDSEEWNTIENFMAHLEDEIKKIVSTNQKILAYYESPDFSKIKETCEVLMSSQREFNEYIAEKVEAISHLFGTRVVRNETIHDDEYNYIRPYKKTITPFTAEVSAAVFASAENNPLEYIVKYFYPDKKLYPEQIQKLYQLVEELETLRDAKQIIENYKAEYQQYLGDVPAFIMENDETGFYSRLGFAVIDESIFAVEYKFSYTSGGGMAQRSFTVPMTEENIAELIKVLESKLTASAFAKEQRTLMTRKLREHIKERDNFTCCSCGNSTYVEPNLLLEIDHIIPVAKGGRTEESNLQTLCWKCNRAKSDKILA